MIEEEDSLRRLLEREVGTWRMASDLAWRLGVSQNTIYLRTKAGGCVWVGPFDLHLESRLATEEEVGHHAHEKMFRVVSFVETSRDPDREESAEAAAFMKGLGDLDLEIEYGVYRDRFERRKARNRGGWKEDRMYMRAARKEMIRRGIVPGQ